MSQTMQSTPRADGYRMPAEWERHQRLLDALATAT